MIRRCSWFLGVLSCLVGCGGSAPPADTPASAPPAAAPETAENTPAADPAPGEPAAAAPAQAATAQPAATAAPADEKQKLGGELTQNEIRDIVEKHGEYFNDCYTIGAGKSKQFVATVTLKVTLGPSGTVNEAKVTKSTAKNPKVDQCVVDGFKKIKFPSPRAGATGVFTFPMEFKGAVEMQ